MTRRSDAIFKNLQNGSEMEGCVFHKIPMSATIFRRLKDVGGGPNLHNVMALPGIFGVVVQMTPRSYGEAKNLLMAALSSEYQHPKVAIAVDADVDIFNHSELLWALTTRVDPREGRGHHPRHAQSRHGREPARTRRAGHRRCGSGSARRC